MKELLKKDYRIRIVAAVLMLAIAIGIGVAVYFSAIREESVQPVQPVDATVLEETTELSETSETQAEADTLRLTKPTETKLSVNKAVFTVAGVCNPVYTLTVNDAPVPLAADGSFSYEVMLKPGENEIHLTNSVKEITLKVTYAYQVIKSISPTKNLTVGGDTKIELQVVALKGARVAAVIGKQEVSFSEADADASAGAKAGVDFVTYIGYYTTPKAGSKKRNLGKIKFSATYDGYTETKKGASVSVNAEKKEQIPVDEGQGTMQAPQISGDGMVEVLTPASDCGLGKAKMCTVTVPYSETAPNSAGDDKSDPRCTPLIKGTVDYIVGDARYDDNEYYLLNSGVKILKKECSPTDGYVLSANTISVHKSYTDGNTNLILTENWKVPFNTEMKKQSYVRGYAGRVYNVASFTASYIDFVFSYTNAAEGSFDLSGSNVVDRAEWLDIGKDGKTTLRVHFKKSGVFYGYRAYYSEDNRLVISFNNRPESLESSVVIIDPGHGGSDCGAIAVNGTYESKFNLNIAKKIQSNLQAMGVKVIMLRTGDTTKSLDDRQAQARQYDADLFISLHNNSSETSALSGPEVYYYRATGKPLAEAIHKRLVHTWQEIYSDNATMRSKADNVAVRFYPFRVTRIEECPAVLVECGYLSNATECSRLSNAENQTRLAQAVSDGIADCLKSYK